MRKLILAVVLAVISSGAAASPTDRVYNFACGDVFVSDIADYANTFQGLAVNDIPYSAHAFIGHRVIDGEAVTIALAGNGQPKGKETIAALSFYENGQVYFTMADGVNGDHSLYKAQCRRVN